MARPKKDGLDYFSMDVDFFNDEKIEAISGEFGIKGEIVAIKLLCAIYRNGYYINWSDILKMKLLKGLNTIDLDELCEIVLRLVKWEFFCEKLFISDNILTSRGIQKRYLEATKRRLMTKEMPFNLVNVNINNTTSVLNDNISTQSKVKESKVKESKEIKEKSTQLISNEQMQNSNLFRQPKIPTKDEVYEYFVRMGGTKEMSESFYLRSEGTSWFYKGSPITNFRPFVNSFVQNWKINESKNPTKVNTESLAVARKLQESKTNEILNNAKR